MCIFKQIVERKAVGTIRYNTMAMQLFRASVNLLHKIHITMQKLNLSYLFIFSALFVHYLTQPHENCLNLLIERWKFSGHFSTKLSGILFLKRLHISILILVKDHLKPPDICTLTSGHFIHYVSKFLVFLDPLPPT